MPRRSLTDHEWGNKVVDRYIRRRDYWQAEPWNRLGRELMAVIEPPIRRILDWMTERLARR